MKILIRRSASVLVSAVLLGVVASGQCHAEDADSARAPLDKVLAVLRLRPDAASKACLNAMSDVHTTERQVKDHQDDTGSHSDLDIARDVLESDYQNGAQICGADAARVCRIDRTVTLQAACVALPGSSAAGP